MKQSLLDTYNQPGNLLVITNYPPKGGGVHAAKIGGVSGFAKNTLVPLAKCYDQEDRKIIVLTDTPGSPRTYEEDGMLIVRCWKRNHPNLYLQILKQVRQFSNVRDILIEFEFASFGDFWVTAVFPILLAALKLSGKYVTLVLHQVVTNLASLVGHIGLGGDSLGMKLFSLLLPVYYFFLTNLTDGTIVLEETFKQRLRGIAPMERVAVIPHGVETPEPPVPKKMIARKKLGILPNEFVILSFGFITWYKGTDLLIKAIKPGLKLGKKLVRLIVAGGPSMTQQHKPHYRSYYQDVVALAKKKTNVKITGFVPNNRLPLYFAAADLVAFPYRTVMSSSGPLSLAVAYGKPIALSPVMTAYMNSSDVSQAVRESGVHLKHMILPLNLQKLPSYLARIGTRGRLTRLSRFSRILAYKRSFPTIADSYYTILTPKEARLPRFAIRPV